MNKVSYGTASYQYCEEGFPDSRSIQIFFWGKVSSTIEEKGKDDENEEI